MSCFIDTLICQAPEYCLHYLNREKNGLDLPWLTARPSLY